MKTLPYILIVILAFGLGWFIRPDPSASSKKSDTVTITNTVRRVDVDTLYLLAPQFYLAWVDKSDTIYVSDTCWHLREYKEYKDSTYYAKVSGVMPKLDEILVFPKTIYETQYIYKDIICKPKRWAVGLSAGYGIGRNGLSPVLAITINYNLWQF